MASLRNSHTEELHLLVRKFGENHEQAKLAKLKQFSGMMPENASVLIQYHDALLFIRAYPDSKPLLKLAEKELLRINNIAAQLVKTGKSKDLSILEGSGLAGTETVAHFSWGLTRYLTQNYPQNVSLYSIEGDGSRLQEILQFSVSDFEKDTIPADTEDIVKWLETQARYAKTSSLAILINAIQTAADHDLHRSYIFENTQIFIRVLFNSKMNFRSRIALPIESHYWQTMPLQKQIDLTDLNQNKNAQGINMDAQALLNTARLSLLSLNKETDPITYAHEPESHLFDMGNGLQIALFHLNPEFRLPLEIYAGYMAFRNGIPYSYGGAWCFENTALIGINIYETFRGGESAMMLHELMRLYHIRYNIQRFRVEPYQLGHENEDGLQSGVFWFYYKLGFRPENPQLNKLAAAEWKKITANKNYKTPIKTLGKLVTDYMRFEINQPGNFFDPNSVGPWLQHKINLQFAGNHAQAKAQATQKISAILNINTREYGKWTIWEKQRFEDFSLLLYLLKGWEKWTDKELSDLRNLMLAKGTQNEMDFIRLWQNHGALQKLIHAQIK